MSDEEFAAVNERLTSYKNSVKNPDVLDVMPLDLNATPVPEAEYQREKLLTINTTVSYQTNLKRWGHYSNFKNTVTYCGNVDVDPRDNSYSFQFTGIMRDYMNFWHQSKLNFELLKTEQPNSIISFDLYNHCWEPDNTQNYHVLICNDEAVVIDPHPINMDSETDLERYLFVVRKNLQLGGIKQVRLCQYDSLETQGRPGRMRLYDVKDDGSLSLHLEIEGLPGDRPRLESVKRGKNYLGMALSNFLKDKFGELITDAPEGSNESRGATNLIRNFVEYWNALDVEESGKQYHRVVDTMDKLDIERYRRYDFMRKWYVP